MESFFFLITKGKKLNFTIIKCNQRLKKGHTISDLTTNGLKNNNMKTRQGLFNPPLILIYSYTVKIKIRNINI